LSDREVHALATGLSKLVAGMDRTDD